MRAKSRFATVEHKSRGFGLPNACELAIKLLRCCHISIRIKTIKTTFYDPLLIKADNFNQNHHICSETDA